MSDDRFTPYGVIAKSLEKGTTAFKPFGVYQGQPDVALQEGESAFFEDLGQRVGDYVYEQTGSPVAGAVGVALPAALGMVSPYGKSKYLGSLGKEEVSFSRDVPNNTWLYEQVAYARKQKRNEFGVPYMGKITGTYDNPVMMKVDDLLKLKGQRGEQSRVREKDLEWLKEHMGKEGKLPEPSGKEYAPYIEVGYDGVPWVSEGNHRIMAAKALGWDELPVEIRYFDGGEKNIMPSFRAFDPEEVKKKYTK